MKTETEIRATVLELTTKIAAAAQQQAAATAELETLPYAERWGTLSQQSERAKQLHKDWQGASFEHGYLRTQRRALLRDALDLWRIDDADLDEGCTGYLAYFAEEAADMSRQDWREARERQLSPQARALRERYSRAQLVRLVAAAEQRRDRLAARQRRAAYPEHQSLWAAYDIVTEHLEHRQRALELARD
jgi:hypothetical protein